MLRQGLCHSEDVSVSQFRVLRALVEMHTKDLPIADDVGVTIYINSKRPEDEYGPARVGLKINEMIMRGYISASDRYQPTAAGIAYFHAKVRSFEPADQRHQYWYDSELS